MHKCMISLAALAALGACNQAPAEDEILPGNWKMSAGMTKFEVPGATEEQAEMFKNAASQTMSQEQCVTDAERKFDPKELSEAFEQTGDCTTGEFDLSDGKILGNMSCKMDDGTTTDVAINGTLSPEKFSMSVETELVQEMLPEGKANVTMEVTGERIGDC